MANRPTKYAHVVAGLPKFVGETPERVALLNQLREEILATPIDESGDWNISAQILSSLRTMNESVQAILARAKVCPGRTSAGFARAYADVRIVLDAINEWRASAQLLSDAYERMMTDQMEAEDVRSVSLTSGASVGVYAEPYARVIDREALRRWCIANGYESQLQLLWQTLNGIAKERTLAGEPPPDGVEVTAKTQVRLNKA
jgi:hypothetical protein